MEERTLERYGAISTINFTPIERSSIVERILLKRESRLQFSATAIQQKPFLPLLKFNLWPWHNRSNKLIIYPLISWNRIIVANDLHKEMFVKTGHIVFSPPSSVTERLLINFSFEISEITTQLSAWTKVFQNMWRNKTAISTPKRTLIKIVWPCRYIHNQECASSLHLSDELCLKRSTDHVKKKFESPCQPPLEFYNL